jgi:hypothetical protein
MDGLEMETCSRCSEHWFQMRLKEGFCHQCFNRDKKGTATPFLMSAENEMDPGDLPGYLPA